ncbi:MAG: type IV pilus twitching motility protein PilT [Armatimonadota bacterium]|nr:type IV pilus twitching motility protein PilT [Armatimonadota bacterium]
MSQELINELHSYLKYVVDRGGSDLILKMDSAPISRIFGDLLPIPGAPVLPDSRVRELVYSILSPQQKETFLKDLELDMAYEVKGLARFRVNLFQQRGGLSMVARVIPYRIQTAQELNLPPMVLELCQRPRGLILVTGPTGSGKTTTLAAMVDYINSTRAEHIVTIEDPVEFVHTPKKSLINQRELGRDTLSFANALREVLRQDPDVILVGEMRDLETISLAVTAAETGHLVLATLHTTDAVQTVDRLIDVFPPHQQSQIRMQVSVNLVGIISQNLIKRADGKGRVAAFETMRATPAVANLIREGKTHQIGSIVQTGLKQGMISMDQYLVHLVRNRIVTYEAALAKSQNPGEFEAMYRESDVGRANADARRRPGA